MVDSEPRVRAMSYAKRVVDAYGFADSDRAEWQQKVAKAALGEGDLDWDQMKEAAWASRMREIHGQLYDEYLAFRAESRL